MGKTVYSSGYDGAPEKIVINAGPSFGQAIKFMLFGAALGAAAMHFLFKPEIAAQPTRFNPLKGGVKGGLKSGASALFKLAKSRVMGPKPSTNPSTTDELLGVAAKYDAAVEDFSADAGFVEAKTVEATEPAPSVTTEDIADRIVSLTTRLKSLGARAKTLVESAGEAVKPTLEQAIAEGKRAAAEVQVKLKKDVDDAGDRPAIAEQDGELPSEKEDKFVE